MHESASWSVSAYSCVYECESTLFAWLWLFVRVCVSVCLAAYACVCVYLCVPVCMRGVTAPGVCVACDSQRVMCGLQ